MNWLAKLKPNRQQLGQQGEQQALAYLQQQGLILIERNYRRPFGEIDLIMRDHSTLVFVEVRSRAKGRFGGAAASITATKQRRLILAAQSYLQSFTHPPACRFDVVAIDAGQVTWLTNVMLG